MIELGEISSDRLMAWTRALAQWIRLSGSVEEREAAAWVAGELRALGYAVSVLSHDAYISLPGPAALRVTRPADRAIPCITHSMGLTTGPGGIGGELVYAGKGTPDDHSRADTAGRFALVEGRATPEHAVHATRAGAAGLVCISGRLAHEMCCSPVWGSPSERTVGELPHAVLLSVCRADGEALRDLCRQGPVEIHATAAVDTGWRPIPIVQGDLVPGHPAAEPTFVMLSGHLDSWYLGAMDNGSANATMLEVARLAAAHRDRLRRGLRVLFWSGHSHGRYASSAWYADTHFVELDERCVAHVNADSLGAIDADDFATNSMPETAALAVEATARAAGARLAPRRVGRNSDQSFLGIGIPTVLGSVSRQADGALGWWWHTPEDTLDKIDPVRLTRDTGIFVHVVERLLADPVLPLDYAASAADIRASLEGLARAAGACFDLAPAITEAARLEGLCQRLAALARATAVNGPVTRQAAPAASRQPGAPAGVAAEGGERRAPDAGMPVAGGALPVPGGLAGRAAGINACLQGLGRLLVPATYTVAGRHGHDPALDVPFLPKLQGVRRLAALPAGSDAARLLTADLLRARSEITSALRRACAAVEACLGPGSA